MSQADVFWIDSWPTQNKTQQQTYFRVWSYTDQEFLSIDRKSNMWPGNEGTGGGRQQALDAKQPLLTGSRKSQADKQTE